MLGHNLRSGKSNACGRLSRHVNGLKNKKYNQCDMTSENFGIGWTQCGYEFCFDKEDYNKIINYCWRKHQDGYLRTRADVVNGKNKYKLMHVLIMEDSNEGKEGLGIDHINRNPFDNRKDNLRFVLHFQNMYNQKLCSKNKSGYKGVFYCKTEKKWKVSITVNKVRHNLGTFTDKQDAINARLDAEKSFIKKFLLQRRRFLFD